MKIERRKVESVGEFSPRIKARIVALLGLSAALSVPAEPQMTTPREKMNRIEDES